MTCRLMQRAAVLVSILGASAPALADTIEVGVDGLIFVPADVKITAVCTTSTGPVTTGQTRPVDVRDGTVKRDLYIPLPRRPLVRKCLGFTIATPGS